MGFYEGNVNREAVVLALTAACLIAVYIFCVYRIMTKRTFYNKNFNISLVALSLITAAIILSIQSSMVISLGMVGALSIVRFRTAVKDPMDLVFLFWSISVGIICGAGLFEIAIFASVLITAAISVLNYFPVKKAAMILVVNSFKTDGEEEIMSIVEKYSSYSKLKSRGMEGERLNLVIEARVGDGAECVREINRLDGVEYVSMVSQEGEVTF